MSIAQIIDHTLLKADATIEDIRNLCKEAVEFGTYSVCVNPTWVPSAFEYLKGSQVKVCTVVGFPLGATYESVILSETELAIANGAKEIDMVMNIGAFKSGQYSKVENGIRTLSQFAHTLDPDVIVKVIVESAVLTDLEKGTIASIVADSGADFLKTSTGFIPNDHLLQDVRIFADLLPKGFKIKAAGGIRTYETAKNLMVLGVSRIGASSTKKIVEEENS